MDVDEDDDSLETLPWDLDSSPRVMRGVVDMGSYEIPFGDLNCDKAFNNGDIDPSCGDHRTQQGTAASIPSVCASART